MSTETDNRALTIMEAHRKGVEASYTAEQRKELVEALLEVMANGRSLQSGCEQVGVNISTALRWIAGSAEWEIMYENVKNSRARALMERALSEMDDNPDYKQAEARARIYMKQAALLNPKEFSDKTHVNAHKNNAGRAVSFTLNFAGQQVLTDGSMTITVQPEGGEQDENIP